jgi:response regulator RpfG family c-di-GMP phosphodiesterase
MLNEIRSIEPHLKQVLYSCVEHVKATKAALYLSTSHDLNSKTYELVTSYQYNAADRKVVTANDDLVDRLAVKRSPFFVNGLNADQRLAEMLFRQGNDRLLATPLFSRGRLIGFIDMRDKAGKKPFDAPDIAAAEKIGQQMLSVLAENRLFGLAGIALADEVKRTTRSEPLPAAPSLTAPTPAALRPGETFSPEALAAIEAARQYLSRRQHAGPAAKRSLSERDVDVVRLILPSALAIPGAVMAALTVIGQMDNPRAVVAVANAGEDALEMLHQHLQALLKRSNQPHMTRSTPVSHPYGAQTVMVTASAITSIQSVSLAPRSLEGLVLTVAFERTPDPEAVRRLQTFALDFEAPVEASVVALSGRNNQAIAERLLEPDFQKFPELASHSREVSVIAQKFAALLELPPAQVEVVRLAALVHDVGLRLLDYHRLYRRAKLTPDELKVVAEHPIVGAALVEPLLGDEVAQAVLRHHERVDGKGYPSHLSGQQIPLASRIIQIADAWVAMTAPDSYRPSVSRPEAVSALKAGAGSQFDAQLVERFLRALDDIVV